nr:MAG TPA: hypothetical protein [Caudoviricetes sp.]
MCLVTFKLVWYSIVIDCIINTLNRLHYLV